ncbi:MAG: hypothetical protein NTZ54_08545 [Alphaproteobacteria bacterium]|nr:hypothetical protein [Alphaproteobacteria bacterium]
MNNYNTAAASEDGATHHSTAPSKPVAVAGDLENLPGCFGPLLALPAWVQWRWEEKRDKDGNTKWTKPPIQINGRLAKNNDPSTWTTHAKANAALKQGRGDGIGLMLAGCPEMIALDLDDCRNAETGELQPWAQELVDAAASYTEVTPSGEGLRIIGVGNIGSVQRRFNGLPDGGALEIFSECNRYICVTGAQVAGSQSNFSDIAKLAKTLVANKGRLNPQEDGEPDFPGDGAAPGQEKEQRQDDERSGTEEQGLLRLIRDGVPEGQRSESFFHACGRAKDLGWKPERLESEMRKHPSGIGAKYLAPQDRLHDEIARAWAKTEDKGAQDKRARAGGRITLDDVLKANIHTEAGEETIAAYREQELHMLNRKMGFLVLAGKSVMARRGRNSIGELTTQFVGVEAERLRLEPVYLPYVSGEGDKAVLKWKPAISFWLKWSHRRAYNEVTFLPRRGVVNDTELPKAFAGVKMNPSNTC